MTVQYAIPRSGVPAPAALRRWARAAAASVSLTVRIVGRREGRALTWPASARICPRSLLKQPDGLRPRARDQVMKVRSSLKSLKTRHRDCKLVRRKGRVYIINKTQRRFKARQG